MDVSVLRDFGFPVAVAVWALYSEYQHARFLQDTLKEAIQRNTEAIQALKDAIQKLVADDNVLRET